MSFFAIRYPFFILMACMIVVVVGVAAITGMPVDLFPPVKIPVVVVATFYAGMPPQQIESDITDSDERFFTLGSNIDHIESRSMSGVSLIKIYFQPGTDPTAAVSGISNLAMANLRRLPPGTLPPVVLSFGRSKSAGLPDHTERCWIEPDAIERLRAIQRAKPGGKCSRRIGSATLRRDLSADHGLRRPVEAAGFAAGRDGRRSCGE